MTVTIEYGISDDAPVTLTVYAVTGALVATLVDAEMKAGKHAVSFDGSGVASGMYIVRLDTGGRSVIGKLLLLK